MPAPALSMICRLAAIAGIQCLVLLGIRRCVPATRLFWPCLGLMALLPALGVCLPAPFPTLVSALALVLEPVCLILPFRGRARESVLCFFLIFYPFILLLSLYEALLTQAGFTVLFAPENWSQLPGAVVRFLPLLPVLWLLCWLPRRFSGWRRMPGWVPLGLLIVDRLGSLLSLCLDLFGDIPADGLSPDALLLLACLSAVVLVLASAIALLVWQDQRGARLRIEQLERQRQMQLDYYRSLSDTLQTFRLLRHDLRHYMNLPGVATSELRDRMQATLEQAGQLELCGDPYLNAVLFAKMRLARDKQVRLDVRAALDGPAPVDGPALICAASNLLENALEACEKVTPPEKRRISFRSGIEKNYLTIYCENTFQGELLETRKGRLLSTKKDGEGHGYGLDQMSAVVRKYHSILDVHYTEDGLFIVQTALRLPEA